jgi:hypothetical protein
MTTGKLYNIAGLDLPEAPAKYLKPALANATPAVLTDEVARIRAWKKYFDEADKFLGEALKARLGGKAESVGEAFQMLMSATTQERISPDLCREHLDAETLKKVTTVITFTQMRFSKKAV